MNEKKYCIALFKRPGGVFPAFHRTYTLEEIDGLTSKTDEETLKKEMAESIDEVYNPLDEIVIIYHDTKKRFLSSGVCFKEHRDFLYVSKIKEFILENQDNKNVINKLVSAFINIKDKTPAFDDLLTALKTPNWDEIDLNNLDYLNYDELRNFGLYIALELTKSKQTKTKNEKEIVSIDPKLLEMLLELKNSSK